MGEFKSLAKAVGQLNKTNAPIAAKWDKLRSWGTLLDDIDKKINSSDKSHEAITLEIGPQLLYTLRHPSSLRCTSHFTSKLGEVFTAQYNKGAVQGVKVWTLDTKGNDGTFKHVGIETEYEITSITYVSKHRVYLAFCTDLHLRVFTDVHSNFAEVFTLPCLATVLCLIYDKEEDEIYAGGTGFLEEWKIQGAEHAASAIPGKKFQTELTRNELIRDIKIDKSKGHMYAIHGSGICVVNLKTKRQIVRVPNRHEGPLKCCCYYPQADYLVTGGADGKIKLSKQLVERHDYNRGKAAREIGSFLQLCLEQIQRAGSDSLLLFNGTAFNLIHVFMGHHGPVTGVEAHTKDTLLFSCSLDGTVRLWRMDSLQFFMRLDIGEKILHLSLLGTTEFFFQTDKDIMIYKLNQFYELFAPVESETKKLICCRGKGKANRILASTEDGSVRLLSPVTGLTLTIMYPMPSFQVLTSFAYDIHQDNLHTVLTDGQVLVYNTATNPCKAEELWLPKCADEQVNNLLLVTVEFECDDGTDFDNLVFAGLKNGQVIMCEAVICVLEAPIQAHEGAFTCLESCQHLTEGGLGVLETSRMIVSGGTDKFVKLWSININTKNHRPTVSLSPVLKIYLPAIPSHVCMFSNLLSVAIKTYTNEGPRWCLVMYQLVVMNKRWGSMASYLPVQITHSADEDHIQELTALDKCISMKVVLTAGKDGFVKIWNSQNELLREMNFLTPIYASCFANDRGDILVGYGTHICSVSVVNYLPLNCLRNVTSIIADLRLKDDGRELPVQFDHKCQPWLDLNKLNKYSVHILERRRQHLEEEVIERLKQASEKEESTKFVIFVDGATTKVIRKDFADRLLTWAKGKNTLKLGKCFDKSASTEDQEEADSQEKGKITKDTVKDAKTNPASCVIREEEEEEEKEYLDSEGLIEIYPSTVGRALRALDRSSVSGPYEMKLLQEKELLKKDPIIAPDGFIPNSVIRRKLKPPKSTQEPILRRFDRPFKLKPVPKVNPDHMPSWWGKDDKETTMAKKEEQSLEFRVTKWEDTPSPTPRSEVISSVSTVSIESFIESPIKKYIREGRSTSPKTKQGVQSRTGRVSKGRSVSRDRDETPNENVKKMIKLNNQSLDKKKKSVWEDSTSSERPETVGLSVHSSMVGDIHQSPTQSETSLDMKLPKVKPGTPATTYKLKSKRFEREMGTPDSVRKRHRSGGKSVERSRSFKLTNLAVDEDSSAIHVKATKSGRRPKSNLDSEIIQQLIQEKWMPEMESQYEFKDVLDNLITVLDNNNPVVYDSVCNYLTAIFKELDIPEDQFEQCLGKLGGNLNNLNSAIKKYTIRTLQVLGQGRNDVLMLILPKLVEPEESIRRLAAEAVEELTGAHNKDALLKLLDEMGLTAGVYSSKEDEELALKVLADRFAEREEDPELFDRIQTWVEGTTPGLFDEERDDDQLWQEDSRSRKSSMYQGNKEQSFMSDKSAVGMYDTSEGNTMYADMPPTPSELSELVLSRDVSMHDSKSAGLKSANSHYKARMDLLDRGGATVLPGEREEILTPLSDDEEYVRLMNERYGLVPVDSQLDLDSGQSPFMGEKSNLTSETARNTPKSLESMLLKERTLTDISQVGPLPSFLRTDNTKNFDDVSTDSAFESAISMSDCATSHFSEKATISHLDQQSSKHSQLSEENNMFDVEVVSTLEYEGDFDDDTNLSQHSKSMSKHGYGLKLEKSSHSMLSEISNSMSGVQDDEPGELTVEITPRESTSIDKKETPRQALRSKRTDTGSTLKKKMHEIDGFSTISDRSTTSRKSIRGTTPTDTVESTPVQEKKSSSDDDDDDDVVSLRRDTLKSGNESHGPKLESVTESKQGETLSESKEDEQSFTAELPTTTASTAPRQISDSHFTTSKGTPANSLIMPLWEESTNASLQTATLTEPVAPQDISAVSLDTLLVSKDVTRTTGFSKETTTSESTFSKEILNFTSGLPSWPEEGTPFSALATPAAPLNTPGAGLAVDLNTVSPSHTNVAASDNEEERFTPKDPKLHKYYDKQHMERVPVLKDMQKVGDRDSEVYSIQTVASSQIIDQLSGHNSGISKELSRGYGKGFYFGAPLSPVKSGSDISTPAPQKGPHDPKDWRKFFDLPNAVERRQMEQIKREMEQGKLKPSTLPPISYFAEDLPMLPGEAGTRLLQSVRVGEKANSGDGKHRIESVPSKLQVHTQNEPAGLSSFGILQMQWTTGVPTAKDKLSPPQRIPQYRSQVDKSHETYLLSSTSLQRLNEVPSEEDINLPIMSTASPAMTHQPEANHYEWELPLPPPPAKESRTLVPLIRKDHDNYCKYYQLVKKKLHLYTSQQREGTLQLPEVFVKQIRERQLTQYRKPSDESHTSKKSRMPEKSTLTTKKLFPPIKIGQLVNIY